VPLPPAAKTVLEAFGKPLHPILGSVAPGGGVAVGIGYDTPRDHDWFHNASAKVTVTGFWATEAETGYQTHQSHIALFGGVRHMSNLGFFGIGPDSTLAKESSYLLRETSYGTRGWLRLRPYLRIGGSAEVYSPKLGSGSDAPSIEKVFAPEDVPGFAADPRFFRYHAYIETALRRGTYQLAAESVRDRDGGQYTFHRLEAEARQQFPGFKSGQRLTLHGLIAVTNQGATVPYYLQYTLGGNSLGAFRLNTIGSDGTRATLRGRTNYRFRDRDIVLMQAEYRVPLREHVDTTVFYDAGQVAGRMPDLFSRVKQGGGFSVSYMQHGATLARLDVGLGGGEGVHVFWTFGMFGP